MTTLDVMTAGMTDERTMADPGMTIPGAMIEAVTEIEMEEGTADETADERGVIDGMTLVRDLLNEVEKLPQSIVSLILTYMLHELILQLNNLERGDHDGVMRLNEPMLLVCPPP